MHIHHASLTKQCTAMICAVSNTGSLSLSLSFIKLSLNEYLLNMPVWSGLPMIGRKRKTFLGPSIIYLAYNHVHSKQR